MDIHATDSGPSTTWTHYFNSIRGKVPLPLQTALLLSTKAAETFPIRGALFHSSGATIYTVGAAILAALANVGEPLSSNVPLQGGEGDAAVANWLSGLAGAVENPLLAKIDPGDSVHLRRVRSAIYSDISCQRSVQSSVNLGWALASYLLGWNQETLAFDPPASVRDAAEHAFGHEQGPASGALGLVVAHGARQPYVHLGDSVRSLGAGAPLAVALTDVIPHIALPVLRVKSVIEDELQAIPGLAARVCAFWFRHPVIHLGREHYMLAPPRFLASALGMQHLFRVLESARVVEGQPDSDASREIGYRFEDFLHSSVSAADSRSVVCREHQFRTDHNSKSPDLIIEDRGDRTVTLVEAKSRGIGPAAFFGLDPEALYADLRDRFAVPLVQLLKKTRMLYDAQRRGRLTDAGKVDYDLLQRSNGVVLAIVVPSLPGGVVGRDFRVEVWSHVEAAIAADPDLKLFWGDWTQRRAVHWIVLDAEDFARLAGWKTKRRLGRTIMQYCQATVSAPTYTAKGPALDICEWIEARGLPGELRLPPVVVQMVTRFLDWIRREAYGPGDGARTGRPGMDDGQSRPE